MRKILVIFFLSFNIFAFTQSYENFKKDFQKSLNSNFNENDLNKMLNTYSKLLVPPSKTETLKIGIDVETITSFPLSSFKRDRLYQNNIST